jgi:hypothetical protein
MTVGIFLNISTSSLDKQWRWPLNVEVSRKRVSLRSDRIKLPPSRLGESVVRDFEALAIDIFSVKDSMRFRINAESAMIDSSS